VHDCIDNANLLVASVKIALDMEDMQHLGHRAQHDVNDGVDNGKTENAFFQMPKNALPELEQRNQQYYNADNIDF